VQWSDLIAALQLLGPYYHRKFYSDGIWYDIFSKLTFFEAKPGHSLHIVESREELQDSLNETFDIIFTDYVSIDYLRTMKSGEGERWFQKNKCKLRVMDCFGTEAEFNDPKFTEPKPYCCLGSAICSFDTTFCKGIDFFLFFLFFFLFVRVHFRSRFASILHFVPS
jgi:hypothetical protein